MRRTILAILILASKDACALAGTVEVTADLRARAIQACTGDAQRLCPEDLLDEGRVVACMAGKRPRLSVPCRQVYDDVSRAVSGRASPEGSRALAD